MRCGFASITTLHCTSSSESGGHNRVPGFTASGEENRPHKGFPWIRHFREIPCEPSCTALRRENQSKGYKYPKPGMPLSRSLSILVTIESLGGCRRMKIAPTPLRLHHMVSPVGTVLSSQEILGRVQAHLGKSSSVVIRGISCDCDGGVFFLRGRVPSTYCRQLAEQSVASVVRGIPICNEITVVTS